MQQRLYDEDLLLVVHKSKPMAVHDLLGLGALTSDTAFAAVLEACSRHNITAANAMFIYSDPLLSIADIHKGYNGLHYMGLFAR
ncbi:immunity 22 family protein [Comamonas sp. JUb58]|uniref:immunity 22 family protein n=1 Tax=Comamonas sp. JUb58 TaxID=2485114 RepID=UPI0010618BAA|nr:immunity 22 family protein [Comamonas sp. JUb58]TDS78109.1 immunity protein 22 of polymorphic toxin system [Comamonas sp. JUb58]